MEALTLDQLRAVMISCKPDRAALFLDPINQTMVEFQIDETAQRVACFLAQIGHESGDLRYVRELASGEAYEGRRDLGNTEPGDGQRFKGRGLIQITGRSNYQRLGEALGIELTIEPEKLEEPSLATRSAGWFWKLRNLNHYVDENDFTTLTKRINGGLNGLSDRLEHYKRACRMLNITPMIVSD